MAPVRINWKGLLSKTAPSMPLQMQCTLEQATSQDPMSQSCGSCADTSWRTTDWTCESVSIPQHASGHHLLLCSCLWFPAAHPLTLTHTHTNIRTPLSLLTINQVGTGRPPRGQACKCNTKSARPHPSLHPMLYMRQSLATVEQMWWHS